MNWTYNFRIVPEIAISIGIAAAFPLLQALIGITGLADITPDWWGGVLAGSIKAAAGAILALLTRGGFQMPGVTKEEDAANNGPVGPA